MYNFNVGDLVEYDNGCMFKVIKYIDKEGEVWGEIGYTIVEAIENYNNNPDFKRKSHGGKDTRFTKNSFKDLKVVNYYNTPLYKTLKGETNV